MTVVRDAQGRLLLHSAIALAPQALSELESLGTLTWLVVPNGHHRLDAPAFKARYPALAVVTPSGAVTRVEGAVPVDLTYEQFPANAVIGMHVAPWANPHEGVMEVRGVDGTTLVFNDLVFVPPRFGMPSWPYRALRVGPHVPWLAKRMYVADASKLRAWLLQLATVDRLACIVPGHGDPIIENAPNALRAIAASV